MVSRTSSINILCSLIISLSQWIFNLCEELPGSKMVVISSKTVFGKRRGFFPRPNFDWKICVKTLFVRANREVEEIEVNEIEVLSSASKTNGPSYSLGLKWTSGEHYARLVISVDLSLAVKIHSCSLTTYPFEAETPAGRVITSLLDNLPYFFAVRGYSN